MPNITDKKAQTALELAIFGSILIFVLGTIIRSSVNRSNQQHAFLKSTRMALSMSHKSTETKQIAGRNMATVLIVEDRLTTASSKYGALDRMPFMTQGSGIHSANLFMPVDFGDVVDLPVFDMFINGQHFAFTTAGFKSVELAIPCAPGDCPGVPGCTDVGGTCKGDKEGAYSTDPAQCPGNWEPDCIQVDESTTQMVPCAGASPCPALPDCPNPDRCDASALAMYEVTVPGASYSVGCAKLYAVVDNHPLIPEWCDHDGGGPIGRCPDDCSVTPGPGCNLSANERFDLDREDLDGLPGDVVVPPGERADFAWQWFMVMGVEENSLRSQRRFNTFTGSLTGAPGAINNVSIGTLNKAEGIVLPGGEAKAKNSVLDVDCDLKNEVIMPYVEDVVSPNSVDFRTGVITVIGVQDSQMGDVDFSYNSIDKLKGIEQFGFTRDVRLYTYIKDDSSPDGGTYFEIDEGKLFTGSGDNRQFIRTASKKDQVDVIERVWRLSNNTGGYCELAGGVPTTTRTSDAAFNARYGVPVNPVEVCTASGGCYESANINLTCMDITYNIIFVRSRIQDLHGRKWVTDMGSDPYVNFIIN